MPGALEFLRLVVQEPLLTIPQDAYRKRIVTRTRPHPIAYACHPDTAREVLVSKRADFERKPPLLQYILGDLLGSGILLAEGAPWRWQRDLTNPMFRHSEILELTPVITEAAENMLVRWRRDPRAIRSIDTEMTRVTYEVIANTVLLGGSERITETIERYNSRYNAAYPWALAYGLMRLPNWVPRRGREVMRKRDRLLRSIVEETIINTPAGRNGNDLLTHLLGAKDPATGTAMSREQLIDNVLTFLIAGHHTTAMALTWVFYLTALYPAWADAIRKEVSHVSNGPIEARDVDRLPTTTKVVKEAMRLFPPVPIMTRIATSDTELAGSPIKRGTIINIPIYALHRHEMIWSDPDVFDPEQFSPEREKAHVSCQFLPFGAGPRICIGMQLALVEMIVILVTVLKSAELSLVSDDYIPSMISRPVLSPKEPLPLVVEVA